MAEKPDTTNLPAQPAAEGHKTRRAALRLFGAAPALAILPAASALALASTASPVHPDAALFAMQSAIDAADREFDVARTALTAADELYFDKEPEWPTKPAAAFSAEEQQAIDVLAAAARKRTPSPVWAAYDQALLDRGLEVERLKAECGVTAAHELEDATSVAVNQVRDVLAETPAKTLAGLIFKARYAGAHYRADYDEEVMVSIVDDLLAMAGDPEAADV
jgi:hypothetical protein